jgi:DNA-binding CsgD family transcriptional regulator
MKTIYELFWNSSIVELKKGYSFSEKEGCYSCLICGEKYEEGVIYNSDGKLLTAWKKMEEHIKIEHESVLNALIALDKKYTGLSDIQTEIVKMFINGLNDSQIAKEMHISNSNVRNHRFRLKEKAKQAKVFLAIYELLDEKTSQEEKMIDIHRSATQIDERYAITEKEKDKCLKNIFGKTGELLRFPTKEKEKLIILYEIIKKFETGKTYSEKDVNEILKSLYHDFPLLRRYLIEYGFFEREADGSSYWVKV